MPCFGELCYLWLPMIIMYVLKFIFTHMKLNMVMSAKYFLVSECRYTILTNQPIKDDAGNETVSTNKSQSKIAQTPRYIGINWNRSAYNWI